MKAKLIKLNVGVGYRLDDEKGFLLGSTLRDSKTKLSFKNCEAIENGYDLDELVYEHFGNPTEEELNNESEFGYALHKSNIFEFKKGFKKALEILGDKKFSEEDVNGFINYVISVKHKREGVGTGLSNKELINANLGVFGVFEMKDIRKVYWQEYLQSLKQTEWDVEIVCLHTGDNTEHTTNTGLPKLDEDGCLILKRL